MHRIVLLTFFVVLGLIMGCSNDGKKVAAGTPSVLDVSPGKAPIPSAEPTLAAASIPDAQPVAFTVPAPTPTLTPIPTPTPAVTAAPAAGITPAAVASASSAAKSYKVKKGDTLFSIAKTQLGSGRDWQKIVAANPGLTPTKLRAGQQIAMP